MVVDGAFLDSHVSDLNDGLLNLYFDGAVPQWRHALSAKIPRRQLVERLVSKLESRRTNPSAPLFQFLLGAGGEGKSTAVLQIAADIARRDGWTVLWRSAPEAELEVEAFLSTVTKDDPFLLVMDDAETGVRWLIKLAQALSSRGLTNVHVLGCARDFDWKGVKADRKGWSKYVEFDSEILRGIAPEDASLIVSAWQAAPPGGRTLEFDSARLRKASREEAVRGEGSFFGGVLATRFSPQGLIEHVKDLMIRLDERPASSGTLRDALAYAALCHAVGIPGLDHRVLADLLGVTRDTVRMDVMRPLGDEAGAVRAGTALMTRHLRVAKVIVRLLDGPFGEDLGEWYSAIVRQTILTDASWSGRQGFSRAVHCGPQLLRRLPQEIPEARRAAAGVAAANASHETEPARLSYIVDLAKAWRAARESGEARKVFSRVTPDPDVHADYQEVVRGFYYEWSVAEGWAKQKENDVWLAAYAISDALTLPVTRENAKMCIAGLGVACLNLAGSEAKSAVAKGMRACGELGPRVAEDQRALSCFDRYRRTADQNGVPCPADAREAVAWLADAAEAVRSSVSASILAVTGYQRPSFNALRKCLGLRA